MSNADCIRRRLVDELRTLDEFKDPLLSATQTSVYERKQALKDGMPASFVAKRRKELEGEYWTRVLGGMTSPLLVGFLPLLFDYSRWVSDDLLLLITVVLALAVALQRARAWSRYRKRVLLYELLAPASGGSSPNPDERPERASTPQHPA
jgi:hypothetical protein